MAVTRPGMVSPKGNRSITTHQFRGPLTWVTTCSWARTMSFARHLAAESDHTKSTLVEKMNSATIAPPCFGGSNAVVFSHVREASVFRFLPTTRVAIDVQFVQSKVAPEPLPCGIACQPSRLYHPELTGGYQFTNGPSARHGKLSDSRGQRCSATLLRSAHNSGYPFIHGAMGACPI